MRWIIMSLCFWSLTGLGCDEDSRDTGQTDATSPGDTEDLSEDVPGDSREPVDSTTTAPDTSADQEDTNTQTCEVWPAPVVGGSAALEALVQSPAKCGMAPYTWLTDSTLGDVVELGEPQAFLAVLLRAAAASAGFNLGRTLTYDVKIRNYRYQTQARGVLTEATSLVAYPSNWDGGALDVVVLLHGTTGFNDACAPSLDDGPRILLAALASMGYVVVAPDFMGLKASGDPTGYLHPYLVGEPTAHASIDAVRAVGQIPSEQLDGLCLRPRYAVFGASQGGHAALWVDRLQPYYAGELELLGTAAMVPPADTLAQIEGALTQLIPATANTIGLYGSVADWYGTRARLNEVFTDTAAPQVVAALEDPSCAFDGFESQFTSLTDIFQQNILDAATAGTLASVDPWGCYGRESGLVTTTIPRVNVDAKSYGILFVLGEADTLVDPAIERESFHTLCSQGVPLTYLECKGAGHVEGAIWALPEVFDFIDARLNNETFSGSSTCAATVAVDCRGMP